MISEGSCDT